MILSDLQSHVNQQGACVCVCGRNGGRQLTQTQQHITSSVNQATGEVKGKEETGTLANHFVIRRQNKTKKCLSDQRRRLPELTWMFFPPVSSCQG